MKFILLLLLPTLVFAKPSKPKTYLTSIGNLCNNSNGCKIETVPKNMKINIQKRSLLVLNEKYERLGGNCIENKFCKIVIKNEPPIK